MTSEPKTDMSEAYLLFAGAVLLDIVGLIPFINIMVGAAGLLIHYLYSKMRGVDGRYLLAGGVAKIFFFPFSITIGTGVHLLANRSSLFRKIAAVAAKGTVAGAAMGTAAVMRGQSPSPSKTASARLLAPLRAAGGMVAQSDAGGSDEVAARAAGARAGTPGLKFGMRGLPPAGRTTEEVGGKNGKTTETIMGRESGNNRTKHQ